MEDIETILNTFICGGKVGMTIITERQAYVTMETECDSKEPVQIHQPCHTGHWFEVSAQFLNTGTKVV